MMTNFINILDRTLLVVYNCPRGGRSPLRCLPPVMGTTGALLLGRRTCQDSATVWPNQTEGLIAEWLNSVQQYVASSTLREPLHWRNSTLLWQHTNRPSQRLVERYHGPVRGRSGNRLRPDVRAPAHCLRRESQKDAESHLCHVSICGWFYRGSRRVS